MMDGSFTEVELSDNYRLENKLKCTFTYLQIMGWKLHWKALPSI